MNKINVKEFQFPFREAVKEANRTTWKLNIDQCQKEKRITGISSWINARRNFSLEKMIKICSYFNIEVTIQIGIRFKGAKEEIHNFQITNK